MLSREGAVPRYMTYEGSLGDWGSVHRTNGWNQSSDAIDPDDEPKKEAREQTEMRGCVSARNCENVRKAAVVLEKLVGDGVDELLRRNETMSRDWVSRLAMAFR